MNKKGFLSNALIMLLWLMAAPWVGAQSVINANGIIENIDADGDGEEDDLIVAQIPFNVWADGQVTIEADVEGFISHMYLFDSSNQVIAQDGSDPLLNGDAFLSESLEAGAYMVAVGMSGFLPADALQGYDANRMYGWFNTPGTNEDFGTWSMTITVPTPPVPDINQRLNSGLNGVTYLVINQNGDGSWGRTNAERVRATQQAIWALYQYHVTGVPFDRAISWIYNAEAGSPDAAARLLLGLSQVSIEAPSLVTHLDSLGYPVRTTSGQDSLVWGAQPGYVPTTLDHVYALRAKLAAAGSVTPDVQVYWGVIASAQRSGTVSSADGSGWGYAWLYDNGAYSFHSAVIPTAEVLLAMAQINTVAGGGYWNSTAAQNAINWLLTQQRPDGGFGDDTSNVVATSLVVMALAETKRQLGTLPANWQLAEDLALAYLLGQQLGNGSWDSDLFTTALAVRAITAGIVVNNVDTDGDQLPDYLETRISGLNPNVYDSVILERGNGDNYRDKPIAITLQVQAIVGEYHEDVLNYPLGTRRLVGQLPPGMSFNPTTNVLSGTPTRLGQYFARLELDLGANDNYIIPVAITVVNPGDDLDQDGMSVAFETQYGLDPFDQTDGQEDDDGDGLVNAMEYQRGTRPDDAAPAVVITAPSHGATFSPGSTIPFSATATDVEDGNLSAGIQWASNIDGALGTGANISSTLSPETHVITATVTDSAGAGPVNLPTITVVVGVTGDINNDGVVDARDILLLQQHLLGTIVLSAEQVARGDLYPQSAGDGELTASDLLLLQQQILEANN